MSSVGNITKLTKSIHVISISIVRTTSSIIITRRTRMIRTSRSIDITGSMNMIGVRIVKLVVSAKCEHQ